MIKYTIESDECDFRDEDGNVVKKITIFLTTLYYEQLQDEYRTYINKNPEMLLENLYSRFYNFFYYLTDTKKNNCLIVESYSNETVKDTIGKLFEDEFKFINGSNDLWDDKNDIICDNVKWKKLMMKAKKIKEKNKKTIDRKIKKLLKDFDAKAKKTKLFKIKSKGKKK